MTPAPAVTARLPTAAVALAVALLLAACGGEGDGGAAEQAPSGSPAAAFPVTIEHKFGTTEITDAPKRVVAVGFNDQDFALALGVTPVGVRQFQAGIDITTRPWAQKQLAGAKPTVVGAEELNFERIASLRPDLILGIYSGITDKDYELLSKIAPTVAQSGEYADYGMPWQAQALVTGRALGREQRAEDVIAEVEGRFARAREAQPELEGKELVLAAGGTQFYAYGPQDLRTRFFAALGMKTPAEIEELAGDAFGASLSDERLRLIDRDALVVYGDRDELGRDPLFKRLDAVREDRVIYLDVDGDFANALGFSSPLSLPFALDIALPRLAAAVDGDPATPVEDAAGDRR